MIHAAEFDEGNVNCVISRREFVLTSGFRLGNLTAFEPKSFLTDIVSGLPVLSPEFLRQAFDTWFNYIPTHKIMLGHDSTHIEMAAGSSLFTREILTESLIAQQKKLKMSDSSILETATDMLQNNAVRLYKTGNLKR